MLAVGLEGSCLLHLYRLLTMAHSLTHAFTSTSASYSGRQDLRGTPRISQWRYRIWKPCVAGAGCAFQFTDGSDMGAIEGHVVDCHQGSQSLSFLLPAGVGLPEASLRHDAY